MKGARALVEQRGYQAIYGDTDSIFIWRKRSHANADAHAVAASLVQDINAWWTRKLRDEQQLDKFSDGYAQSMVAGRMDELLVYRRPCPQA